MAEKPEIQTSVSGNMAQIDYYNGRSRVFDHNKNKLKKLFAGD